MNKLTITTLLVSSLGVVSAAHADLAAAKRVVAPAKLESQEQLLAQLNYGTGYGLKERLTAQPKATENDPIVQVKSLTGSQVNKVVSDKMVDVENCWLKLPAKKRTNASATLRIAVENGMVVQARVDGELPKGVAQCITAATDRWAFPVTDARSEIEQGLVLNAH